MKRKHGASSRGGTWPALGAEQTRPRPSGLTCRAGRRKEGRKPGQARLGQAKGEMRAQWLRQTPAATGPPGHPLLLLLLAAISRTFSLEIEVEPSVQAFVGEPVTLKCWFRSSVPLTEKLTIDWTFRPLAGGSLEPVFHYQSEAYYPAQGGTFQGRVLWAGDVGRHDASIRLASPTPEDNGTFSCTVRNPPDVQHNIPQTLLTVTWRGASFQLTSAGLLSLLVFLPSALVVMLLGVRMGRKSGLLKAKKKFGYKKSSIEVSDKMRMIPTDRHRGRGLPSGVSSETPSACSQEQHWLSLYVRRGWP
ncbi:myelin protein zero-like protein 3 isoform X2 [Sceloporus undulatus]|uniref:myelin protein zero-like protein 3 isoform X2 n=1 Tax=Sceloporus undulatus TaxID=8520 RepID=UPI001C4C63A1|nr:myelin protein zero-like protein 3 isoform X2 [Sceloporus undulatus]